MICFKLYTQIILPRRYYNMTTTIKKKIKTYQNLLECQRWILSGDSIININIYEGYFFIRKMYYYIKKNLVS